MSREERGRYHGKREALKVKLCHENMKMELYHGKRAKRWRYDAMMGMQRVVTHGI